MGFFEKLTSKVTKTASEVFTDSVKNEVKEAAVDAIPALIGAGTILLGFIIFPKGKSMPTTSIPSVTTVHTVTNNYFLDEASKAEMLAKIIEEVAK